MCAVLGAQGSGMLVRHTQTSFKETAARVDRHRNTITISQSISLLVSPKNYFFGVRVWGYFCRWATSTVLVIDYMLDLQSIES